jgi:hypothetical protein
MVSKSPTIPAAVSGKLEFASGQCPQINRVEIKINCSPPQACDKLYIPRSMKFIIYSNSLNLPIAAYTRDELSNHNP